MTVALYKQELGEQKQIQTIGEALRYIKGIKDSAAIPFDNVTNGPPNGSSIKRIPYKEEPESNGSAKEEKAKMPHVSAQPQKESEIKTEETPKEAPKPGFSNSSTQKTADFDPPGPAPGPAPDPAPTDDTPEDPPNEDLAKPDPKAQQARQQRKLKSKDYAEKRKVISESYVSQMLEDLETHYTSNAHKDRTANPIYRKFKDKLQSLMNLFYEAMGGQQI